MTMRVLQTEKQISDSRAALLARGMPKLETASMIRLKGLAKRFGVDPAPSVGDLVKSWDVLETLLFLEKSLPKDAAILDMGAYSSEILVLLDKAGFTDLTGVDLNPKLKRMPAADRIRYVIADFMATELPSASYAAMTSISVIEHGYNPRGLFTEVARLLRPEGYFIASFDYWPDKIATPGVRFFDMDWLIFSRQDVEAMIEVAATYGLHPVGDLRFEGTEKAIRHGGFAYTFGWIAFQKRA